MVEKMSFRLFVVEKFYEHSEEVFSWTGTLPNQTFKQYFFQNKWYLKRLYKTVYINS